MPRVRGVLRPRGAPGRVPPQRLRRVQAAGGAGALCGRDRVYARGVLQLRAHDGPDVGGPGRRVHQRGEALHVGVQHERAARGERGVLLDGSARGDDDTQQPHRREVVLGGYGGAPHGGQHRVRQALRLGEQPLRAARHQHQGHGEEVPRAGQLAVRDMLQGVLRGADAGVWRVRERHRQRLLGGEGDCARGRRAPALARPRQRGHPVGVWAQRARAALPGAARQEVWGQSRLQLCQLVHPPQGKPPRRRHRGRRRRRLLPQHRRLH
mmetsp:Transcript_44482/g.111448  ORF Transcript_44482/g.111448 Transcript_44482/m.111448 type:complete len:267 (+) Transcript_44482:780-1580(+)